MHGDPVNVSNVSAIAGHWRKKRNGPPPLLSRRSARRKGLREKIRRCSIFVRKDLKFGRFEDLKLGYLLKFVRNFYNDLLILY